MESHMSFMYLLVCSSDISPNPAPEKQRPDLITVIRTATLISSDQVKPHQQGVGKIRKVKRNGRSRGGQEAAKGPLTVGIIRTADSSSDWSAVL